MLGERRRPATRGRSLNRLAPTAWALLALGAGASLGLHFLTQTSDHQIGARQHGLAVRQDRAVYAKAWAVATKLTDYINYHGNIPASMTTVTGSAGVPSTVSYHKLSTTSYEFCTKYQTATNGFRVGGGPNNNATLYLDPEHHGGKNCQTVNAATYINLFRTHGFNPLATTCVYNPAFGNESSTVYEACVDDFYANPHGDPPPMPGPASRAYP